MKIIAARTDGIGDLLCSTALFNELKRAGHYVGALVSDYAAPVVMENPDIDKLIIYQPENPEKTLEEIKREGFDASICVYPDFKVASLLKKSGIKERYGTLLRWHSLFNFNRPVLISRKKSVMHEAEYNLKLAKRMIKEPYTVRYYMYLTADEKRKGFEIKAKIGLEDNFVIVHPGSKGSSWNPSAKNYALYCDAIAFASKRQVLIAGSESEKALVYEVFNYCVMKQRIMKLELKLNIREYASLIAVSSCFVSGSTGPMHIAAALSVPTLSFFPPDSIPQISEKRWGPLGNAHAVIKAKDGLKDPQEAINSIKAGEVLLKLTEVLR